MTRLFLVDADDRPDPSPEVVARRLRGGPPPPLMMSRPRVLSDFGLTDEEFAALKKRVGIKTGIGVRLYDEGLVAQGLGWHGPLPSEVAWLRKHQSRPETLEELQAVYNSNPDEWVYRCYHGAELVYVGVTRTGMNRVRSHMAHAEWLRHVTCIEVEHFASREESERREAELIARFAPRFNRTPGRNSLLKEDA